MRQEPYDDYKQRTSLNERPASLAEQIGRLQETASLQMERIGHLEKLLEETREQLRSLTHFVGQDESPLVRAQ